VTLIPVLSRGDVDRQTPLYGMGSDGIFVKEVQQAVLDGLADAAVHSCKDLPTAPHQRLAIAAIPLRADPRDALVGAANIAALAAGAMIGTSSLRRQAQLRFIRPDLRFTSIRGNVETRLRKVAAGEVAATVMAWAGLSRLGLLRAARAVALNSSDECTPAPAQGAIALECRQDDRRTRTLLGTLDHRDSSLAITIERRVLAGLRGGCSLPLGCLARRIEGRWQVRIRLGQEDGSLIQIALSGAADGLAERALSELAAAGCRQLS
jgi:hydroxymethylbilane synthase